MKTVAIVEDNPDNLLLLRVLLSDFYQLQEYVDGASAIAGIIANPPDVVLMDISLPDMSGIDVLNEIRSHHPLVRIPIIAFTAHAMLGDREKFLDSGFDAYISKPIVEPEQLLAPIKFVVHRHNSS